MNKNPQAVTFESVRKPNHVLAHTAGKGTVDLVEMRTSVSNLDAASFLVQELTGVEGRINHGWMSFQSCLVPGNFIRQRNGRIRCEKDASNTTARGDSTWELVIASTTNKHRRNISEFDDSGFLDPQDVIDVAELRERLRRAQHAHLARANNGLTASEDPSTIVWASSMEMSIGILKVLGEW